MRVNYFGRSGVASVDSVFAKVLLTLTFLSNSFNNVVIVDVLLPFLKPAARNQIKGVVKFTPVGLIKNVEELGYLQ